MVDGDGMRDADEIPVIDFLGLRFHDLDVAQAARVIVSRDPDAPFAYVVTPNAQHVVHFARGHEPWLQNLKDAWLVLVDGRIMPMLARRLFGRRLPVASGSDLTVEMLKHHIRPDDPVTVIGGGSALGQELVRQFGLTRLALHDPPMGYIGNPVEVEKCIDFLAAHPARYVFLATGAPRSETLARAVTRRGGIRGVGLCIGGSLLFATGLVKRAPVWMQRAGLEAVHRLWQHPRTHLRRIFLESLPVVWIFLRARLGGRGILPGARPPA